MSIVHVSDLSREERCSLHLSSLDHEIRQDRELAGFARTLAALGEGEIDWAAPQANRRLGRQRLAA